MEPTNTYSVFLKLMLALLLVGQLGTALSSYGHLLADVDTELIELSDVEDGESEKETDKEEKDNKLQPKFSRSKAFDLAVHLISMHFDQLKSMDLQEITTPPPKLNSSIS